MYKLYFRTAIVSFSLLGSDDEFGRRRRFLPLATSRAAVYDRGCPEGIRVVTNRALPAPSRNALLVRVKACGVNPVDAKGVIGDKLPPFLRGFARRLVDGKTAGFDLSGVVEQAPPGCGFAVGDEVYGAVPPFRGALAELVSVPLDQVARKPESLTHEQAAALVLPSASPSRSSSTSTASRRGSTCSCSARAAASGIWPCRSRARGRRLRRGRVLGEERAFVESVGAHAVAAYDRPGNDAAPRDALIASLESMVARRERPFDLVIDTVTSHDERDASCAYERRVARARRARRGGGGKKQKKQKKRARRLRDHRRRHRGVAQSGREARIGNRFVRERPRAVLDPVPGVREGPRSGCARWRRRKESNPASPKRFR